MVRSWHSRKWLIINIFQKEKKNDFAPSVIFLRITIETSSIIALNLDRQKCYKPTGTNGLQLNKSCRSRSLHNIFFLFNLSNSKSLEEANNWFVVDY